MNVWKDMGPLGWFGYMLFAGSVALYYRLWISSGNQERKALKRELKEARELIGKLKSRNVDLDTAHTKLHGEYLELRGQFSQLQVAFNKQAEMVAQHTHTMSRLVEDLKREKERSDERFTQLLHERAKNGNL